MIICCLLLACESELQLMLRRAHLGAPENRYRWAPNAVAVLRNWRRIIENDMLDLSLSIFTACFH